MKIIKHYKNMNIKTKILKGVSGTVLFLYLISSFIQWDLLWVLNADWNNDTRFLTLWMIVFTSTFVVFGLVIFDDK